MSYYSTENARRSLLHTATFRVVSQVATLASYVMLVRALSEQDFGVFNLLYAIIPVVGTLASLGIEQTLRRFEPEYLRSGQIELADWLLRACFRLRAATNLLFLGVVVIFWSWLAPIFKIGPYRAEFLVYCVIVLLHFQAGLLQLSLSSHMLHRYSIGMTVLLSATKLVIYSTLAARDELTLMTAILADCGAYGLMFAGLRMAHARHCRHSGATKNLGALMPLKERRRLLRYGLYNNFNDTGALLLSSHSDNLFVAAMMTPLSVGTYAFYVRLNDMAEQLLPMRQFSSVMLPMFFSTRHEEAADRIPRYFTFLVNVTLCVHLPILAFFLVFHSEIVALAFAGKFISQSSLLPLITAFGVVGAVSECATLAAQYHERTGIILVSKVFALGNVIGMLLLVPLLGVFGAAISTGTSIALKNGFMWWHVRDSARWSNFRSAALAALAVWGCYVLVCTVVKLVLPGRSFVQVVAGVALCGIFSLAYLRTPALSDLDREMIRRLVGERGGWLMRALGIAPRTVGT